MPRKKRSRIHSVRSRTAARRKLLASHSPHMSLEPLEVRRLLSGLLGSYYNNMTLTGNPTNTRVDGPINFNWTNTNPVPGVGPTLFSVQWTGQIQPAITQTYTFTTITNDGVRLWVNGEQLINHWNSHPAAVDSGSITLIAGQHYNIEMDYFQNQATSTAELEWAGPGQIAQPIPADVLFPQTATGPANVPTQFTATAVSANEVDLNWSDNSSGADGAIIRRSTDGVNFTTIAELGGGQSLYADNTVSAGSTYYYQVIATSSAGQSGPALAGPVTTPGGSGVIVNNTGLLAVYYSNVNFTGASPVAVVDPLINFNWASGSPAPGVGNSNYSVQWTGQLLAPATGIYNISTTSDDGVRMWLGPTEIINDFTDHPLTVDSSQVSLVAGQKYSVVIQYFNDDATPGVMQLAWTLPNGTLSIIPTAQLVPMVVAAPVPTVPASLTATASAGKVTLSWAGVSGASSYDIYRGSVSGGESATPLQTGVTGTSFVDSAVTAGSSYFYEVTAVNGGGQSGDSPEAAAVVPIAVPTAPASLSATASVGQVALSWAPVQGASSYDVYRGTVSGGESVTPIRTGITSTSFTDSAVTAGSSYFYEVTAVNSSGQSSDSPEAAAVVPSAPPPSITVPAAPAAIIAYGEPGSVILLWSDVSNADSYDVYRGTVGGGESATPLLTGLTSSEFVDSGVTPGKQYYYEVTAVNSGGQSVVSREAAATVMFVPPAAPASLTATASAGQVALSWAGVSGANSYDIYRGTVGGGESATPFQTGVTATNFTDSAVSAGTKYFYEVTAVNGGGQRFGFAGSVCNGSDSAAGSPCCSCFSHGNCIRRASGADVVGGFDGRQL